MEGIEDVAYISTQFELSGQTDEFRKLGCHFIVTGGKTKMSRFVGISRELNIPSFIVFDSDSNKGDNGEKEKNKKDNKCILNLIEVELENYLPEETSWGDRYVLWGGNIGEQVKSEFKDKWDGVSNVVKQEIGISGDNTKKNAIVISSMLEKLESDHKKQSTSLIKLCGNILRHAQRMRICE